jgi:pyruvate carboxylase subunit B
LRPAEGGLLIVKYLVNVDGVELALEVTGDGRLTLGDRAVDAALVVTGDNTALLRFGARFHRIRFTRRMTTDAPGIPGRREYQLWMSGTQFRAECRDERAVALERLAAVTGRRHAAAHVIAPMPGLIIAVKVQAGDSVAAGQSILVMEAMKMENELRAAGAGIVRAVHAVPGKAVEKGAVLVEIA